MKLDELEEKAAGLKATLQKVGAAPRTADWTEKAEKTLIFLRSELEPSEEHGNSDRYNKICNILEDCSSLIAKIIANNKKMEKNTEDKKEGQRGRDFDLQLALKLIKDYTGRTSARDFVDSLEYYNDTLSSDGSSELVDFVYRHALKEDAKRAFLTKPKSVADISSVLLRRFKTRETVDGLQRRLGCCVQGNWSVSKFASVIENIMSELIELQLATRTESERETIQSLADEAACAAFKAGARPEIQVVLLAAAGKTFAEAIDVALGAEASNNGQKVAAANVSYAHTYNNAGMHGFRGNSWRGRGQPHYFRGTQQDNHIAFPPRYRNFNAGNNYLPLAQSSQTYYRGRGVRGNWRANQHSHNGNSYPVSAPLARPVQWQNAGPGQGYPHCYPTGGQANMVDQQLGQGVEITAEEFFREHGDDH